MSAFVLGSLFGFVMGFVHYALIDDIVRDEDYHQFNGKNGNGYQPKSDIPHDKSYKLGPPRKP